MPRRCRINVPLLANCPPAGYPDGAVREMNSKEIGKLLLRLRQERGMTQRQAAERLCVSTQAVSKWERGVSQS